MIDILPEMIDQRHKFFLEPGGMYKRVFAIFVFHDIDILTGRIYTRSCLWSITPIRIKLALKGLQRGHTFSPNGNATENAAPLPGSPVADTVPPCLSTMRLTIARPAPVPINSSSL